MAKLTEKQQQAWRELSREIGGELVAGKSERDMTVVLEVEGWTVKLHQALRDRTEYGGEIVSVWMTALYVRRDGFRFKVGHKGWFARPWRKLFGVKDIPVGYPEFDTDFFVKGNDEFKVRALFANRRIRELIQSQPSIDFKVLERESRGSAAQGVNMLHCDLGLEIITDIERLKCLFQLFQETLNQLCHIGSASEDKPNLDVIPAQLREYFGL